MWLLFHRRRNWNMLARTNKGDLGAERRADLDVDENDHSSMSVDLFCEKHD